MDVKHVFILYYPPHPNMCPISLFTLCQLGYIGDFHESMIEYRQNEIKKHRLSLLLGHILYTRHDFWDAVCVSSVSYEDILLLSSLH